jgi:hypothetical protein
MLKRLEALGLSTRLRSASDERTMQVEPTVKGGTLRRAVMPAIRVMTVPWNRSKPNDRERNEVCFTAIHRKRQGRQPESRTDMQPPHRQMRCFLQGVGVTMQCGRRQRQATGDAHEETRGHHEDNHDRIGCGPGSGGADGYYRSDRVGRPRSGAGPSSAPRSGRGSGHPRSDPRSIGERPVWQFAGRRHGHRRWRCDREHAVWQFAGRRHVDNGQLRDRHW